MERLIDIVSDLLFLPVAVLGVVGIRLLVQIRDAVRRQPEKTPTVYNERTRWESQADPSIRGKLR
jgi:hypothetical protein